MLAAPFGDGIREHGAISAEEGTRLDLDKKAFFSPSQEEVEAAIADGDFPADEVPVFPAGDAVFLNQPGRRIIIVLRIEQNRDAVALDADDVVSRPPLGIGCRPDIDRHAGKEQFPHAAGIGHMASHDIPIQSDMGDEAVGPVDKGAVLYIMHFQ